MPVARFQMPDGRVARFEVPEGTTPEQAQAMMQAHFAPPAPSSDAPAADPSMGPSVAEKVGMGITDPIHGGAQLLTHVLPQGVVDAGNKLNNWIADKTGLVAKLPERNVSSLVTGQPTGVDALVAKREADYQAKRAAAGDTGFDWWRTGGNIISPVNKVLPFSSSGSLATRAAVSAASGAGSAALAPVSSGDFWDAKRDQVLTGAAFGGATPVVASGVSRVISPKASTNADLSKLKTEGVTPTIGQTLGGRWNALEEKAQSIPILGDFIANARGNSLQQFNNAAINRASGKVGAKVEGSGQEAVAQAGDALSGAYEASKKAIGHFQIDKQGAQELGNLQQLAQSLQPAERKAFNDAWSKLKSEVSQNGSVTADSFGRLDSFLSKEVGRFGKSSDAYQQQAADAFKELQRILNDNALRANPDAAKLKAAADAGWANLVRVEGAAKAAKNTNGVFTPGQLNTAIQQADRSVRGRAVARGQALMQDLSNAGQNVIGNKVPNSFTTDRALLAGGGLGAGLLNPAIPLGLAGGGLLYTQPAQRILSSLISSRPQGAQEVANALREASPGLGLLSTQVGLNLAR